ncbi:MAG: ABC transporter substrate-binding protein [Armatimonadetes bacterium]|nr:ABC transporter substrate-binding protein [Armatimonadota bacterium]
MPTQRLALSAVAAALLGLASWAVIGRPGAGVPSAAEQTRRVVSLSPALTELVYALGAGERLVGISDFTTWPPEALKLPNCGGAMNPNLELLLQLHPDLIVLQGENEKVRSFCETTGKRYWGRRLDTLSDLNAVILGLGQTLGVPDGEAVWRKLSAELAAVRAAVEGRPPTRVLVCVGRQKERLAGITTCGGGTFLDDLVTLAGGRNVFADAGSLYPEPSLEELTARAPDVILDLQPEVKTDPATLDRLRGEWRELSTLPAVRNHRVVVVTENYVLVPGPRIGAIARHFAASLHPDVAGLWR